jgi:hypothetical protein
MIVKSGRIVIKDRNWSQALVTVPRSTTWDKNTGAFMLFETAESQLRPFEGYEKMIYTLGKSRFNQCIHDRVKRFCEEPMTTGHDVFYDIPGDVRRTTWYSAPDALEAHATAEATALSTLGNSEFKVGYNGLSLNDLAVQGMERMRPDLTQVSLPNFLLDISQLKDLINLWRRNISLKKNLAGGFLNYKFGWKPTVGDLQGMAAAIRQTGQSIGRFSAMCGQTLSDHCRLSGPKTVTTVHGSFDFHGNSHYPCKWTAEIQGSVTAHVRYRVMPILALNEFDLIMRGFADALGVQLNPRILWDKLPFSFVVDWFLSVGNFLDRFSIDALELPIQLVDFCLQFKQSKFVRSQLIESTSGGTVIPPYVVGGCETREDHFRRVPIFPDSASLAGLNFRLPNFNQAILGVALATVLKTSKGIPKGRPFGIG